MVTTTPPSRSFLPQLLVIVGFFLQLATMALLLYAGQQRETAQQALDAEWARVNAEAQKHNPPVLPPEKPAPAALPGVPWILSAAGLGSLLIMGGARLWANQIKTRRQSMPAVGGGGESPSRTQL